MNPDMVRAIGATLDIPCALDASSQPGVCKMKFWAELGMFVERII